MNKNINKYINTLPTSMQLFMHDMVVKCNAHGIDVIPQRSKIFYKGDEEACGGYFCPFEKKLVFDAKYMELAIHEYGHFLQYIENSKLYLNRVYLNKSAADRMGSVLEKKTKVSSSLWKTIIKNNIILEHDCAKRMISLYSKYKLMDIIDKKEMIQGENLNILSYHWVFKNKRLLPCSSVGQKSFDEITSLMPKRIVKEPCFIDEKQYKTFLNYFGGI